MLGGVMVPINELDDDMELDESNSSSEQVRLLVAAVTIAAAGAIAVPAVVVVGNMGGCCELGDFDKSMAPSDLDNWCSGPLLGRAGTAWWTLVVCA